MFKHLGFDAVSLSDKHLTFGVICCRHLHGNFKMEAVGYSETHRNDVITLLLLLLLRQDGPIPSPEPLTSSPDFPVYCHLFVPAVPTKLLASLLTVSIHLSSGFPTVRLQSLTFPLVFFICPFCRWVQLLSRLLNRQSRDESIHHLLYMKLRNAHSQDMLPLVQTIN